MTLGIFSKERISCNFNQAALSIRWLIIQEFNFIGNIRVFVKSQPSASLLNNVDYFTTTTNS